SGTCALEIGPDGWWRAVRPEPPASPTRGAQPPLRSSSSSASGGSHATRPLALREGRRAPLLRPADAGAVLSDAGPDASGDTRSAGSIASTVPVGSTRA